MPPRKPAHAVSESIADWRSQSTKALFGAIFLSVAGSLPLHLAPLIVVALVADGTSSRTEAGWLISTILIGQLLTSITVPLFRLPFVSCRSAFAAIATLLLALAATLLGGSGLFLGWFLVGCSCGILIYLGTVSAAQYRDTTFAFSWRLGLVLVLAAAVSAALLVGNALATYRSLLFVLFLCFGMILLPGIALYRPLPSATYADPQGEKKRWHSPQTLGLAALFILFMGQTGFIAFVIQTALDRGMGLAESTWAIVAMKMLGGLYLVTLANTRGRRRQQSNFLGPGVVLGVSVAIAAIAEGPIVFFIGLVGFEIAFNTLSAQFQARIAESARHFSGRWLTATMLLGAACGPPLNGIAIASGLAHYFLVFAILSAALPMLWARLHANSNGWRPGRQVRPPLPKSDID